MEPAAPHVYTISALTAELKALLEGTYPTLWVEGEVSNFKHHASGHMYFTLKDAGSQIRAVMFRTANRGLKFRPEDGLSVLVRASLGVYEPRGEYQLYVEHMEPKGLGALQLAFEQLKARLAAEGLFDEARKRPIPRLPRRIGIVTSPSGAAIRDMLNIIDRRFANVEVVIYPARVQGEEAAGEIAAGIEVLNARGDLDVLIVGRGGGSIEDLWAFNEERVARAIAASKVPVISAVGHETDFTIADFVADLRAPTPSAAAELVVAHKAELAQRLDDLTSRLETALRHRVEAGRQRLTSLARHLGLVSPVERVRRQRERVAAAAETLWGAIRTRVKLWEGDLRALAGKLESLSPLAILARGYSITRLLPDLRIVKDAGAVRPGEAVSVLLHRGSLACRVESTALPAEGG
ncbi:MAG TPA: exodeoxyribonuclease VII large subunit [Candidatus Methylomirabilis sp.]|jgi:exodeoxyribonuclease VII large subunit|nr:exodeoxyribonuclease VII large subunit [Candidatus Methylomirabilis sp.]